MLKISLLFKKFTNFSRHIGIKNSKFSRYCFYMNTNLQGDFQIWISVPLMLGCAFADHAQSCRMRL